MRSRAFGETLHGRPKVLVHWRKIQQLLNYEVDLGTLRIRAVIFRVFFFSSLPVQQELHMTALPGT